jgi:hypothetical protein
VAVAVRVADLAVLVVDPQLRSLVSADLTTPIDSILLLLKVSTCFVGSTLLHIPTTIWIGDYMMASLTHTNLLFPM